MFDVATRRLLPLLCLTLAACGSGGSNDLGVSAAVECAPFARALTGVSLTGTAEDWWRQAGGRYDRTQQPEVGSVLVFRRTAHLPSGHVSVVSRVVSRREILVTSANWVHHRVTEDQPVLDISDAGDWTAVRVWWPPAGGFGITEYPIHGFIRPDHPIEHNRLIAATPAAIRIAEQAR
jgi:surface antigen